MEGQAQVVGEPLQQPAASTSQMAGRKLSSSRKPGKRGMEEEIPEPQGDAGNQDDRTTRVIKAIPGKLARIYPDTKKRKPEASSDDGQSRPHHSNSPATEEASVAAEEVSDEVSIASDEASTTSISSKQPFKGYRQRLNERKKGSKPRDPGIALGKRRRIHGPSAETLLGNLWALMQQKAGSEQAVTQGEVMDLYRSHGFPDGVVVDSDADMRDNTEGFDVEYDQPSGMAEDEVDTDAVMELDRLDAVTAIDSAMAEHAGENTGTAQAEVKLEMDIEESPGRADTEVELDRNSHDRAAVVDGQDHADVDFDIEKQNRPITADDSARHYPDFEPDRTGMGMSSSSATNRGHDNAGVAIDDMEMSHQSDQSEPSSPSGPSLPTAQRDRTDDSDFGGSKRQLRDMFSYNPQDSSSDEDDETSTEESRDASPTPHPRTTRNSYSPEAMGEDAAHQAAPFAYEIELNQDPDESDAGLRSPPSNASTPRNVERRSSSGSSSFAPNGSSTRYVKSRSASQTSSQEDEEAPFGQPSPYTKNMSSSRTHSQTPPPVPRQDQAHDSDAELNAPSSKAPDPQYAKGRSSSGYPSLTRNVKSRLKSQTSSQDDEESTSARISSPSKQPDSSRLHSKGTNQGPNRLFMLSGSENSENGVNENTTPPGSPGPPRMVMESSIEDIDRRHIATPSVAYEARSVGTQGDIQMPGRLDTSNHVSENSADEVEADLLVDDPDTPQSIRRITPRPSSDPSTSTNRRSPSQSTMHRLGTFFGSIAHRTLSVMSVPGQSAPATSTPVTTGVPASQLAGWDGSQLPLPFPESEAGMDVDVSSDSNSGHRNKTSPGIRGKKRKVRDNEHPPHNAWAAEPTAASKKGKEKEQLDLGIPPTSAGNAKRLRFLQSASNDTERDISSSTRKRKIKGKEVAGDTPSPAKRAPRWADGVNAASSSSSVPLEKLATTSRSSRASGSAAPSGGGGVGSIGAADAESDGAPPGDGGNGTGGDVEGVLAFVPATKRDVALLTAAVEGLSTEVRNITSHLAGSNQASSTRQRSHGQQPSAHVDDEYEGDDEEEPIKITKPVKHRSPEELQLAADVQAYALVMLGRKDKSSRFRSATVATPARVLNFDPDQGPCCDAKNFCLDLAGTPASTFNASATKVFVEDFIAKRAGACKNRVQITKMFRSHFKTLQRHYNAMKDASAPATSSKAAKKNLALAKERNRRYQGKYALFHRRLRIAKRFASTKPHIKILQRLGVDGMSSDEEDAQGPFVRYRVFKKTWRHAQVTEFLRTLDALYRKWRRESGQAPKRGSMQRRRYLVDEESNDRPAVPRLPKNAYDPDWLAELTPTQLDDVSPCKKEKYDFSHDRALKRSVAKFREEVIDGVTYV